MKNTLETMNRVFLLHIHQRCQREKFKHLNTKAITAQICRKHRQNSCANMLEAEMNENAWMQIHFAKLEKHSSRVQIQSESVADDSSSNEFEEMKECATADENDFFSECESLDSPSDFLIDDDADEEIDIFAGEHPENLTKKWLSKSLHLSKNTATNVEYRRAAIVRAQET